MDHRFHEFLELLRRIDTSKVPCLCAQCGKPIAPMPSKGRSIEPAVGVILLDPMLAICGVRRSRMTV
jgi:hypothetical protein